MNSYPVVKDHRTPSRVCVLLFLSILLLASRPGFAQEATPSSLPPGWITPTPKGLVAEPALLRKLVSTSESRIGDERSPADGLYIETGNMITGEGWISLGPGYRRHVLDDRLCPVLPEVKTLLAIAVEALRKEGADVREGWPQDVVPAQQFA